MKKRIENYTKYSVYFFLMIITTQLLSCKKNEANALDVTVASIKSEDRDLRLSMFPDKVSYSENFIITFSKDIETATSRDFSLVSSKGIIEALSVTTNSFTVIIDPVNDLSDSTIYILTIAKTIKGKDGGSFSGQSISFRTDTIPTISKLKLTSVKSGENELIGISPVQSASISASFVITFNKEFNPVTSGDISLVPTGKGAVPISIINSTSSIIINPNTNLLNNTFYTLLFASTIQAKDGGKFDGKSVTFKTTDITQFVKLDSLTIGGRKVSALRITDVGQRPVIKAYFSDSLNATTVSTSSVVLNSKLGSIPFTFTLSNNKKNITVVPNADIPGLTRFTFQVNNILKGADGQSFPGLSQFFYTKLDPADKFPQIPDDELLSLVQRQTLKYFYDNAHPTSGMAPERRTSPNTIALGGSGFGVMALIAGVERGFITRQQGLERWTKIVNFLKRADRFHGAWSHWINGNTAKAIPFSANDDGGDLVETAFMVQGLITLRQYLNKTDPAENILFGKIDSLCNEVEWDWYRRNNQNVLYWHWSPRVAWAMNFPLRGWNETLIPYILAASSTTHTIPKEVYTSGFTTGNTYRNGQLYYGIPLPLGEPLGGPLFFSHYSFLGLKPTQLNDINANYWTQNVNHSKINYAYCVANPKKFVGYSADCWGLTASDNHIGYSAHSPTNDLGVITPTAALSSFPYTPVESMRALKYFYYKLGDRTWGEYGFYDAFNQTEDWYGKTYLAIDQGPIVVMMENYRTGLLWNLFMSAPEVQQGLTKLGFTY